MKPILFVLLLFSLCSGCMRKTYRLTQDEKLANQISHKVAVQLKKDLELYPFGTSGRIPDKIELLGLAFQYYKPVKIKTGRALLISAMHRFIDAINESQPIRRYLSKYPFTPQNIEIRIFLRNPDHSEIALGDLAIISYAYGFLEYEIHHPETKKLTTIHKETYEEALQQFTGNQ